MALRGQINPRHGEADSDLSRTRASGLMESASGAETNHCGKSEFVALSRIIEVRRLPFANQTASERCGLAASSEMTPSGQGSERLSSTQIST